MTLLHLPCDTLALSLPEKFAKYYDFSKDIVIMSNNVSETCLKVLAGIVVLLLGTEKVKPIKGKLKYIYFILFPALLSLTYSYYLGIRIQQYSTKVKILKSFSYVRAHIYSGNAEDDCLTNLYIRQNDYMLWGVALMALWLLVYFMSWFFSKSQAYKPQF